MKRRIERFLAPLIIGLVLVGVLAATLNRLPVQAAPAALGPVQVFTLNTASIAATTTFTPTATGGRWSDIGGEAGRGYAHRAGWLLLLSVERRQARIKAMVLGAVLDELAGHG